MSFRYYSYLRRHRMDIPSEFRYLAKVSKSHAYVLRSPAIDTVLRGEADGWSCVRDRTAATINAALVKMGSGCRTCYF